METSSPNVLFNLQVMLEKTSQIMRQKLLLILMLISFSVSYAQRIPTRNGNITVTDVNSILFPSSNTSARVSAANTAEINAERLRSLITQVQSSTYFYEGTVNTYGEIPTNLFTDLGSLNQIDRSIALKDNIEIVTVRINTASELNSTIDLAAFSNFPNLKYIYFITKLNTTSDNIATRISNYDSRFSILYKIDKGDSNQ